MSGNVSVRYLTSLATSNTKLFLVSSFRDFDDYEGHVLVVGGESYPKDVSKSAEIFDLARHMWINLKPLPRPIYGSPAVVDIGTRMVPGLKLVMGGYSDTGISDGILIYDGNDWFNYNVTMKYPRAIFPTIELK